MRGVHCIKRLKSSLRWLVASSEPDVPAHHQSQARCSLRELLHSIMTAIVSKVTVDGPGCRCNHDQEAFHRFEKLLGTSWSIKRMILYHHDSWCNYHQVIHIPRNKYPYSTLPYQITYITIPCNTGSVSFQILVSATVPLYRKASDSRHKVAAITLMREMCLKVLTPCLGRQIADLSEEHRSIKALEPLPVSSNLSHTLCHVSTWSFVMRVMKYPMIR